MLTGIFLSIHYGGDTLIAFDSVRYIIRDVNNGWILRIFHANGARAFFFCLFLHTGRGLYYSSFNFFFTWMVGVTLLIVTIATAFLGYVLPWGQISFWGTTVITNLFSAFPFVGPEIVSWLWGGFSVSNATLGRFYSLHFLLPFILVSLRMIHILFLHQTGSRNPLGVNSNYEKLPFHPYYRVKDSLGFCVFYLRLGCLVFFYPWILGDPENFIRANPLVTPIHIQPEWYFLFAYAILRSIPNKLGGVLALFASLIVLYILAFSKSYPVKGLGSFILSKYLFWGFSSLVTLLTWIGARPVEEPYVLLGQTFTILYFLVFSVWFCLPYFWFNSLNKDLNRGEKFSIK